MKLKKSYFVMLAVITFAACSSLKIIQIDFSTPIESVLKIDGKGMVSDPRFGYSLSVKPVFFEETKDSVNFSAKEVRVIRDVKGYYYLTAATFKNIYIFESKGGALQLHEKVLITKEGMQAPVMNQKNPYIEVVEGGVKYLLNNEGIKK